MSCKKLDLDKLLQVYCEGIYAMDPKTALPFWDYDFAPIFGDLWARKMIKAAKLAQKKGLSPKKISSFFDNIAVPRKEIIYSMVDLKVGEINKEDRLFYMKFWWDVVCEMCKEDCLVEKSNIVHSNNEINNFLENLTWEKADKLKARQVGNIAMEMNSLAYGLYTDIFAHNCMENFGTYDVSDQFGGSKHIMVIKQWTNCKPDDMYPEFKEFPFDKLNIYAVYKDIDYTVDIYTHQIFSGNATDHLVKYSLMIDDDKCLNDLDEIKKLSDYLVETVANHYIKIKDRGFEEAKKIWVLSRNYQFKEFFKAVGMDWYDKEMLERIKDKDLIKTDHWDFDKYSKEILFDFWKNIFDPRIDTFYKDWDLILKDIVNKTK